MTQPSNQIPSSIFKTIEGEEFQDKYDLHKIVGGIHSHLFLIIGSTLLFAVIGAIGMWHYLHNYRAESFLVFQADETKTLPGGIPLTNINLATAVDMVAIPANLQALKSMLGLDTSVKELQEKISVSPPRMNSNLIKITAIQSNPTLAIDMSNTLARIAVKASQDYYKDQLKIALFNYRDQLEAANQNLGKQMKEIEDFKTQNHYFEMDNKNNLVIARLTDLRNKLQDATLQYNGLLVEYENLKREVDRMSEQQFPSNLTEPGIGQRYNALESALVDARMKYSKDNPRLKALEDEMKQLRQSFGGNFPIDTTVGIEDKGETMPMRDHMQLDLMRLQGRVRSAQKMKEELTNALTQLSKEMENLPNQQVAFSRLLQGKEILDEQVTFLNNSIDLTQLLLNNPRGSLGLYQLADKAYPLKEAWWVKIFPLLAGFFGFLVGLALSFFEEMRDPYFRTPKQLDKFYNLPCIGVIPEISHLNKRNAEAKTLFYIRHLVEKAEKKEASLNFPAGHPISIALMSCGKGEGKSLISHHMALYYTRLGRKTLLMEFDPSGETFFQKTFKRGQSHNI